MNFEKVNSWAKVNLSLNVIKRLSSKYHNIESLITFIKIYDEIKIKISNEREHKIYFTGKFSKGIPKNNTIIKLLNLLEKKKIIKNKKFEIKVKKKYSTKIRYGRRINECSKCLEVFDKKKNYHNL